MLYDNEFDYPFIDPLNEDAISKSLQRTQNKAKTWSYEKEYRVVKTYFPKIATETDRIIHLPNDFYAEITIGLDIPEKSKNEIIEIARKRKIKVYQAIKIPFKFKIERELIP